MILKEIYLYPDLVEYENNTVHTFRYQSRSICNYLERTLKKIKFNTDGFKRICFIGKSTPSEIAYVNSSNILIVEIPFDEKQYISLDKSQLNTFFSKLLIAGIYKCQKFYAIPSDKLIGSTEEFIKNNGINRWTFKKKLIKNYNIKCILNCQLTIEAFYLNLEVIKEKKVVFNHQILSTVPDEIVFSSKFKNIELIGEYILILDKFDEQIYKVNVNKFG